MKKLTRRQFVKSASAMIAAASTIRFLPALQAADPAPKWYKGNLHMHTQWSDGSPLPEWAVHWYKSHGYHFICPSDHNIFQDDTFRLDAFGTKSDLKDQSAFKGESSFWKPISHTSGWSKLNENILNDARELFGKDSVRTKKVEGRTYVRMKTFDELSKQFCSPEQFLMIPGYEQTGGALDGRQVHMNFINVRKAFPYIRKEDPLKIFESTFQTGTEVYQGENYLFTANHPLWRYYDFSPSDMIALPQIRLWELNNNDIATGLEAHPKGWKPEKFWDAVNAWRAAHDQPLMFGMGSDDRHGYSDASAKAWTVVRAAKLDTSCLLESIRKGDFYASNGLDFEEIQFDGKTLSVRIKVREEGKYRIIFIGTKKDYDPQAQIFLAKGHKKTPTRRIEIYSDSIGTILDTVEGTEGSYTLKPDDLYVRAKIVKITDGMKEDWESKPAAWSQPYRG
ncbi:MAG: hypothetical protein Q4G69_07160 [Planctomycetia bacterium]|nr:hypothetical protein [Planctomycetia bacterium]